MLDVIIIGGGAVGSFIAGNLAGAGFDVFVLDKEKGQAERVCCTGIVSPQCLGEFGIDESLVLRRFKSARLFSPAGNVIKVWRQTEQACVIDRAGLNSFLANRAIAAGAEYIYSSKVIGLRNEKERVVVVLGGGKGFEARVAVIATGFSPSLFRATGLEMPGDFTIGAQAEVETSSQDGVEVYVGNEVAPGFFGWMVPAAPGRALVGLMSRRHAGLYLEKLIASLESQGKIKGVTAGPLYRGIALRAPRRTFGQRLVIAGGAAGQVKPITGGGLYYGLIAAEIAARHLAQALKDDDLSAAALSGYEKEWKKRLGWEINVGYRARRVFEGLSDARIESAFDIIRNRNIAQALAASDDLSFDWHSRAVISLARRMALPAMMGFCGLMFKKGPDKVKNG